MVLLDRSTRDALIERVARGLSTQADAELLDRLLLAGTATEQEELPCVNPTNAANAAA